MSRPRFLADQDFNEHIIQGVWRLEPTVEFLRVRDIGLAQESDSEALEYAAKENWIVISHDVSTMSAAARDRLANRQPMTGLFLVHLSVGLRDRLFHLDMGGERSGRMAGPNRVSSLLRKSALAEADL